MGEAGDEAGADRIGGAYHDDRNRRRGFLGGEAWTGTFSDDEVDFEPHEIGDQIRVTHWSAFRGAVLDGDVFSFDVAEAA